MSFSLQPKRFVNSEHIGLYAQLELPFGKKQSAIAFKIHYIEEGSGEPVVLVHSAGQSLYTWNALVNELSANFRVIAVDLAGCGYSDTSPYCRYTTDDQVTVLERLLSKLRIDSAHFVGFSLGCNVVAAFCSRHPEKAGRAILLSPGGVTANMPGIAKMLESPILGFIGSMLINPKSIKGLLGECFLDLTTINDDMVMQYAKPLEFGDARRALRLMVSGFDEDEFTGNLAGMKCPVHMLIASDDKWRHSEQIQPYFDVLKNGTSAVIRNAGHLMHEEKPEKVLAAIKEFILPPPENEQDDNADE